MIKMKNTITAITLFLFTIININNNNVAMNSNYKINNK